MSESISLPAPGQSECTQATAIAEAAATLAQQAATKAAAAKAKAAAAAARAAAVRAGAASAPTTAAAEVSVRPEAAAAVLAAARAKSAASRNHFHRSGPAAAPGVPLEPIAHSAGLHVHGHRRRRILSPGLAGLLLLMSFFGLYATGNLPQFDRWTDHAITATQSDNAQVVGAITGNWHNLALGALGLCFVLTFFLLINRWRSRHA